LISSLALVETHAVLARMRRDDLLVEDELLQLRANLAAGPWEKVAAIPDTELVPALADRHRLRGADLWHLSLAVSLSRDLPELRILTWDTQLRMAATAEGL
jgi:predicted nucleic acid-binding protein